MKLIRATCEELCFELGSTAELLRFILESYPMALDGWPSSANAPQPPPSTPDPALLAEALREQKRANQRELEAFLETSIRLDPASSRATWHIPRPRMEWLLQVLNEVRVGSWYRLGCPEEEPAALIQKVGAAGIQDLARLSYSGLFIQQLLEASEQLPG